ncbi:Fe-S cluster assembly protein NifU [Tichowtungia aerotolerans]|uniref:Nitrogen fixation protein NifU n=1 Tax=Tichowtungia aerotolerans TaxID=2697043 RepID=A0A6P1MET1_9BACT|nr:Fe-S cluster assembly protein NifU [Tichowtungia aerotolerans]QHI70538.1 Fe-S cluster assembly protein NifU [Tichowtungia aerotolerans]
MWDYTDKVNEHFRNPHNVGKVENPDGEGQVGSLACGDALKLMFKLDDEGRISEAKFQTFGCASAIASSSALTDMIIGKTLEEAEKITNKDIADYLGGLPKQKVHCSVMGREALEAAIYNYRTGKTWSKEIEGEVVCHCFGVTDKEIEEAIRNNDAQTVEDLTDTCKAGGGCGNCIPELEAILKRVTAEMEAEKNKPVQMPMTNLQKIHLIEDVIDREVRPALRQDGGDLELIDVAGDIVTVRFRGACSGCVVSAITLKDVVEARLKENVSEDITVEEIK